VDERGYYRTTKHHLVRFRFDTISDAALGDLAPENVLFELGFSSAPEPDGSFTVTLDSAMGGDLGGHFRARFGEVLEVTPCNANGHV
jgi:hypothetical protein